LPRQKRSKFAAPETLEDALPILCWDARTAVLHANRPRRIDVDDHLCSRRRMREHVFDQIAQRICDRRSISNDNDRVIGAGERDGPARRQSKMRHRPDHLFGKLAQVHR
jgi:hypothetical protein